MPLTPAVLTTKIVGDVYSDPVGSSQQATGTSGVSQYADTWMIEKQRMDITYKRVPQFGFIGATSATLSATNYSFYTQNTKLQIHVNATYSKEKIQAAFDTSGHVQPQTFSVVALSADPNGMTYGPDADFNASTLGPGGAVVTAQEWYWRRKWDATIDTETAESCNGINFYALSSPCTNNALPMYVEPYWGHYNSYPQNHQAGTAHYDNDPGGIVRTILPSYFINGPYSYDKESNVQLIAFINQCGQIQSPPGFQLYTDPTALDVYNCPDGTEGCISYSTSRHQFA